jgi:hypothetical protein
MALQVLFDAVYRNDADGFLREYLNLLLERPSLTLPTGDKLTVVKLQWHECLPVDFDNIPDLFLRNLSQRWMEVQEKLGRTFHSDYAKDALKVVNNQKSYNKKLKEIVRVGKHSVTIGGDPRLKTVISSVSDDYYKVMNKLTANTKEIKTGPDAIEFPEIPLENGPLV